MRTLRPLTVAAAATLPFLLVACGDDGDGGAAGDNPYVEAIADAMRADEDFPLESDDADCLASEIVDAVGVDTFEDAGIEPDDITDPDFEFEDAGLELDEDTAEAMVDAFGNCDISFVDLMVDQMAAEGDVDDDLRDCIADNLDEDLFGDLMVQGLLGNEESVENSEEFVSAIFGLLAACPELADVGS